MYLDEPNFRDKKFVQALIRNLRISLSSHAVTNPSKIVVIEILPNERSDRRKGTIRVQVYPRKPGEENNTSLSKSLEDFDMYRQSRLEGLTLF